MERKTRTPRGDVTQDILPASAFADCDVVAVGKLLLGHSLYTKFSEHAVTGGVIVETEAYGGTDDRACHAYGGRRTTRTETMYAAGGITYVYLCYGMHALLNIVTGPIDQPHAVLIRAIEPTHGLETILARRRTSTLTRRTAGGPGALTKALGITCEHNGLALGGPPLWVSNSRRPVPDTDILATPRVGVSYAGEDAMLPRRFRLKHCPWTSSAP